MFRTDDVILNPGDFHFAGEGTRIRTLLGSCVSITVWHPGRRVGGMCHYMIPRRRESSSAKQLSGRYGDEEVQMFLRELDRNGTRPEEYQVKMFGGGNQFPGSWRSGRALDIPRDNIEHGLLLLERNGFRLTATHLGGTGSRHILFDLVTGEVWLRHTSGPAEARSA